MRIALVTTDDRDERGLYDEPNPIFGTAIRALLDGLERLQDCEIHLVCCARKPLASPEKLAENLYYHSLLVPQMGWLRTGYLGCIRAVRWKLREIGPDLVHGQGTERYCAMSAVHSGYPNVVTIHGNMARMSRFATNWREKMVFWLAARLEKHAWRRTDGVFCNSIYTESVVNSQARRTWRVPNALRLLFFSPLQTRLASLKPVILNIGTVAAHKQQVEILRWAKELHDQGLGFELRFMGPIDEASDYGRLFEKELAAARVRGYASHLGVQGADELLRQLAQASALVHCSMEESFGLVVAEALSRNLKFFGMNTGGVADIALEVDGAELVDFDDWYELNHRVRRWIEGGCPQPRHAASAMRERYHPDLVARLHLEIYGEVLAGADA